MRLKEANFTEIMQLIRLEIVVLNPDLSDISAFVFSMTTICRIVKFFKGKIMEENILERGKNIFKGSEILKRQYF